MIEGVLRDKETAAEGRGHSLCNVCVSGGVLHTEITFFWGATIRIFSFFKPRYSIEDSRVNLVTIALSLFNYSYLER